MQTYLYFILTIDSMFERLTETNIADYNEVWYNVQ